MYSVSSALKQAPPRRQNLRCNLRHGDLSAVVDVLADEPHFSEDEVRAVLLHFPGWEH